MKKYYYVWCEKHGKQSSDFENYSDASTACREHIMECDDSNAKVSVIEAYEVEKYGMVLTHVRKKR